MARTQAEIIREARKEAVEIIEHLDAAMAHDGVERFTVLQCTLNHTVTLSMSIIETLKTEQTRTDAEVKHGQ